MTTPTPGWAKLRHAIDAVFETLGCFDDRGDWLDTPDAARWRAKAHAVYAAADALAARRSAYPTLTPPGALNDADLRAELHRAETLAREQETNHEDADLTRRYERLLRETLATRVTLSEQAHTITGLRRENDTLTRRADQATLIVTSSTPRKKLPGARK